MLACLETLEAIGTKVIHGTDGSDPQSILDLGLASFGEWQALHRVSPEQPLGLGSAVWLPPSGFYEVEC